MSLRPWHRALLGGALAGMAAPSLAATTARVPALEHASAKAQASAPASMAVRAMAAPAPTPAALSQEQPPANPPSAGTVQAATPATAPADAIPTLPAPPYAAALRKRTRQILAGPDFREHDTLRYPVPRDWLRRWLHRPGDTRKPEPPRNLALLGTIFQYIAVVVLALGLGWLLWRGWQWLAPQMTRRAPVRGAPVSEVRHLALPDSPLPEAVAAAARAAWGAGDAALALSLLYRGAVRELARRYRIELPDSATEGECLRLARQSGAAVVPSGFAPIVQAWMALAYARRTPADFDALLALYARHFETRTGAPS